MATNFKKYTFRGLKNPVYLPDWLTVEIKIISSSVAGWTSGQYVNPSNFTSTTFHDTGNPNSNAINDYNWAANGGRRTSPGSYNGIFDANRLIITQWFDELVGHAANHQGNVTSYAFEHAFGGANNSFDASWKVGMWVHAGILQAMGRTADTSMYQHNYWSGKDCPGQIRRRGLWSATEKGVDERIQEINDFLAGVKPPVDPPVPAYAKPIVLAKLDITGTAPSMVKLDDGTVCIYVGDRVRATKKTRRYQWAGEKAPDIGPNIEVGEEFNVDWLFENGEGWWYYTPHDTRIKESDTVRVSDSKS